MKRFNIMGTCNPDKHYMVDISERLAIIREMIRFGDYFCINRGRQYGKTTTLKAIKRELIDEFCIFSISFGGGISDSTFAVEERLYSEFVHLLAEAFDCTPLAGLDNEVGEFINGFATLHNKVCTRQELLEFIKTICQRNTKPIVLLIDEVDQAGNHPPFLKFLGLLRELYLNRDDNHTFQSVILAGVYDIKNLKLKIRPEEQHQYNSPWNIAAPFDIDMSLPTNGISQMLSEYKADHNLSFNEHEVAQLIREYTSGYPFLVSRICQLIDQKHTWDKAGVLQAVNALLIEGNTLFDDMVKKLDEFPELEHIIRSILFNGSRYQFNYYDKATNLALMFGFIKRSDSGAFAVACRLFEVWFYDYFISQQKTTDIYQQGMIEKNQFIHDGIIDMPRLMEHFSVHMNQTYSMDKDAKFIEDDGRKIFLTYLRPIINGIGSYHIEEQTRDHERMDVVIDYHGQQYVIELKIWRGDAYNERGEEQLCRYLEYFNLQTGYMLSFCFNKNKTPGLLPPVQINGRTLIEAIV